MDFKRISSYVGEVESSLPLKKHFEKSMFFGDDPKHRSSGSVRLRGVYSLGGVKVVYRVVFVEKSF